MNNSDKPLPLDDLAHILAHTAELWEKARGKTFFITGGTGFFGKWLTQSFAYANHVLNLNMRAVVMSRQELPSGTHGIQTFRGDLLTSYLKLEGFDYLIHAAHGPMVANATNYLMQTAKRDGVKNILFTSSGAVYGDQPANIARISEDYPALPSTDLGADKRMAEISSAYHGSKIARCFAFIGPGLPLDGRFAAGNFLGDVVNGGPIRLTDGENVHRSYLYAADLTIWLWTILFKGQAGREYNVGSEHAVSIEELALEIGKSSGLMVGKQYPSPGTRPNRYIPDTTRAQRELGLEVWIPRDEAIRRTLAWLG